MILGYYDKEGSEPEYLISENSRSFENKRQELKTAGRFKPFEKISEPLPAVYFGFTLKIVKGPISLFAKLEETFTDNGLPVKFKWQYLSIAGDGNSGKKQENGKNYNSLTKPED